MKVNVGLVKADINFCLFPEIITHPDLSSYREGVKSFPQPLMEKGRIVLSSAGSGFEVGLSGA